MVKLSIIGGSLYFIYNKIVHNSSITFDELLVHVKTILLKNDTLPILIFLSFLNWFFEIWKWKILANTIRPTSFTNATKQSLASLTVSLLTPNRIGDYGAKALYFPKNKWKVMLLNLVGNINQLTVTIVFGIVGVIFFLNTYDIEINPHRLRRIGYLVALAIIIPFSNKKLKLFGFIKVDSIWSFVKKINLDTHIVIFIFSLIRYLIFSYQFYFLMQVFGVETDYFTSMHLIFIMYFIASFIPSMSLFDWAIKGSVAIYVFGFAHIPEHIIITITLIMWILNFAIPAIIGSVFVLDFKLLKN